MLYSPVLVEPTTALLGQMLGPHGGESAHAEGGLDVAHGSNDDHRGRLQDGDGLNDLLLVDLWRGESTCWLGILFSIGI